MKRLKNIDDKTDDQLKAIKNKDSQLGIKSNGYLVKEELSQEAKNILKKLSNQEKIINYRKLYLKGGNNSDYDFTDYKSLLKFLRQFITEKLQQKRLNQFKKSLTVCMVHWKNINQENSLTDMFEQLNNLVKNQSKISAKKIKMTLIEAGLEKLKNDMRNMSENEIRNKRLDVLANFIEEVLIGDRMNDMPPLETEEDAAKKQKGQGLKVLTPQQMITRLRILLAQLKAGNNS